MNIFEWFIFIVTALSVLIIIYLSLKQDYLSKKFNVWLYCLLLVFFYNISFNVLYWSNINKDLLVSLKFTYLLPMSLYGPFFYFYTRSITIGVKAKFYDIFHFIPLFLYLYTCWNYYVLPLNVKLEVIHNGLVEQYLNIIIPRYDWFLCLVMMGYTLISYAQFKQVFKKDRELKIWLIAIHLSFSVFVFSFFAYYILVYTGTLKLEYDYFITALGILFLLITIFYGYQYPQILNGKSINKIVPFVKYDKTGLSKDFSLELKENLIELMKRNRPYLDSELRLDNLAKELNISRNHASQVINEHFSKSFFDFINSYRVQEAVEMLKSREYRNLTISEIAYQSGFNNKVSFYNAFKKTIGKTPTEFRRQQERISVN